MIYLECHVSFSIEFDLRFIMLLHFLSIYIRDICYIRGREFEMSFYDSVLGQITQFDGLSMNFHKYALFDNFMV